MHQSFEYDPAQILELARSASLEEIRDAYRKTKKHHPDHGGDEWAFRLLTQAYEALGQARVAGYLGDHDEAPVAPRARPTPRQEVAEATVRRGIVDKVQDPTLLVDVESLILRMELENPYEVLTSTNSNRNLSCSLSLSWPSTLAEHSAEGQVHSVDDDRVTKVREAFGAVGARHMPVAAWDHVEEGRFTGLLAYPSARATSEAFMALRDELRARGLGANQWTHKIVIPREHDGKASGNAG